MLLIEGYHHLNYITEQGEGKLEIEDCQPSWSLILFDTQSSQFVKSKPIGPPVSPVNTVLLSTLDAGVKLRVAANVGDAGKIGVVHHQQLLLFCVNHVKLDEVSALV